MTTHTDDTTAQSKNQTTRYHRVIFNRLNAHVTLTVADLADEIAVEESGKRLADIDPQTVCDIYFELCEKLLPYLARSSFVAYDAERELVSLPGYGIDAPVDGAERTPRWVDESESA